LKGGKGCQLFGSGLSSEVRRKKENLGVELKIPPEKNPSLSWGRTERGKGAFDNSRNHKSKKGVWETIKRKSFLGRSAEKGATVPLGGTLSQFSWGGRSGHN